MTGTEMNISQRERRGKVKQNRMHFTASKKKKLLTHDTTQPGDTTAKE